MLLHIELFSCTLTQAMRFVSYSAANERGGLGELRKFAITGRVASQYRLGRLRESFQLPRGSWVVHSSTGLEDEVRMLRESVRK